LTEKDSCCLIARRSRGKDQSKSSKETRTIEAMVIIRIINLDRPQQETENPNAEGMGSS